MAAVHYLQMMEGGACAREVVMRNFVPRWVCVLALLASPPVACDSSGGDGIDCTGQWSASPNM